MHNNKLKPKLNRKFDKKYFEGQLFLNDAREKYKRKQQRTQMVYYCGEEIIKEKKEDKKKIEETDLQL